MIELPDLVWGYYFALSYKLVNIPANVFNVDKISLKLGLSFETAFQQQSMTSYLEAEP